MSVALTEAGWKTVASKFKIKDNGLDKALSDYQKLPLDHAPKLGYDKFLEVSDKRSKALKEVQRLAASLLKEKPVAANKDVTKYLKDLDAACVSEEKVLAKDIADVQAEVKKNEKDAADREEARKHPDPKMLEVFYHLGYNDGRSLKSNQGRLFANAPPFQAKYNEGYNDGRKIQFVPANQGPSMSPISKEDEERSKQYTKDKARRKEFVKYLNEWWGTVLPEDM
jgi:hypothetical protein